METDKQFYTWFDNGVEHQYHTPAFGIANLGVASSAIEKFLGQNAGGYIEAHLRTATELTQKTFQTASDHKVGLTISEIHYVANMFTSTYRWLNGP